MKREKIAVIGLSGRFPDANSVAEYFENCLIGRQSVKKLSDDEMILNGVPPENLKDENYIKYGAPITDIDKFDNKFFKMTPFEASITDPQQRMFLKCAWEALEDAGYVPSRYKGKIGVFASQANNDYLLKNVLKSKDHKTNEFDYSTLIGNNNDSLATRVSYKLGLRGPSFSIQSSCSGSLVSVHYACQSIIMGDSDVTIAGGVSLNIPQIDGYYYQPGSTFSKNGQVRPFDSEATGMVKGNGCGVVVLKSFDKAVHDHDNIYCVIDGSAVNNDGDDKVGYTAPSISGQTNVINETILNSGISTYDVKYIEAHGTGTKLGDPIEVRALSKTYGLNTEHKILLGSVKANIGHLDAASGIVGLIKCCMILNKNLIPKSINFDQPNSQINFNRLPFHIETEVNTPLNENEKNVVCVSSFGIGGTNAHCILENYKMNSTAQTNYEYVIPLSAKSKNALKHQLLNLKNFLQEHSDTDLSNIAFTLCCGRKFFNERDYLIASNINEAIDEINKILKNNSNDKNTNKLSEEWKAGKTIAWNDQFTNSDLHRVSLPTYPFEEVSLWINPDQDQNSSQPPQPVCSSLEDRIDSQKSNVQEILREVEKIWSKALEMKVMPDDDFFDLGGESLIAIGIINDLNKVFQIELNNNTLTKLFTPMKIAQYIYDKKSVDETENLDNMSTVIEDAKAKNNLFMIHPVGGSTYCYNKLAKYLVHLMNIYAIGFPQNVDVDTQISDLSEIYANQVEIKQPTGPIYIGGYSFGGNVALKTAAILRKRERIVNNIFMIDSIPAQGYSTNPPSKSEYATHFPFVWNLLMSGNINNAKEIGEKYSFGVNDNLDTMILTLKNNGEITDDFKVEDVKYLFGRWIANVQALSTQDRDITVDIPITNFFAKEKMPDFLYQITKMNLVSSELWSKHSTKGFKNIGIEANHWSMMNDEKCLQSLAEHMNNEINAIVEDTKKIV